MYFCIDPPATALFAAIFLGESIHARQVIGGMLILVGMYVTIKFSEGNISKSKELENDAMEGITLEYNDEDEDEEFGGESGPLLKNVQGKIN